MVRRGAMDGASQMRVQLSVTDAGSRMAKNNDPKRPKDEALASEIDALLKKLPQADPDLVGRPTPAVRSQSAPPPRPDVPLASRATRQAEPTGGSGVAVWARVALGVVLGVGLTQWPYRTDCGWPLLGYGASVVVLLLTAGWCTLTTWRHRAGVAHVVSLLLAFWGIVLSASILLPRIGYASEAATWRCHVAAPAPAPAPARAAPSPPTDAQPPAAVGSEGAPGASAEPADGGTRTPPDSTGG
jgi:hypothetical protein